MLYVFFIVEVLGVLFFGGVAISTGINLVFPPVDIETPKSELMSLAYLPLLLIGISVGFMWLAFKTVKIINGDSSVKQTVIQDIQTKYGDWKVLTVSIMITILFTYVVITFLGPK